MAQSIIESSLSVPTGCRSFCIGWLNLNKFNGWYQGGGGWLNGGTKAALAAVDHVLSESDRSHVVL